MRLGRNLVKPSKMLTGSQFKLVSPINASTRWLWPRSVGAMATVRLCAHNIERCRIELHYRQQNAPWQTSLSSIQYAKDRFPCHCHRGMRVTIANYDHAIVECREKRHIVLRVSREMSLTSGGCTAI